ASKFSRKGAAKAVGAIKAIRARRVSTRVATRFEQDIVALRSLSMRLRSGTFPCREDVTLWCRLWLLCEAKPGRFTRIRGFWQLTVDIQLSTPETADQEIRSKPRALPIGGASIDGKVVGADLFAGLVEDGQLVCSGQIRRRDPGHEVIHGPRPALGEP